MDEVYFVLLFGLVHGLPHRLQPPIRDHLRVGPVIEGELHLAYDACVREGTDVGRLEILLLAFGCGDDGGPTDARADTWVGDSTTGNTTDSSPADAGDSSAGRIVPMYPPEASAVCAEGRCAVVVD